MTTSLKNVEFQNEVQLFSKEKLPSTPIAILYAFADSVIAHGQQWLQTEEAKALLHTLTMYVHGRDYRLIGSLEQKRLEQIFLFNR